MKTFFILMAQYDCRAVIPIDLVQRDYFSHLDVPKLLRKCAGGEINLPIIRTDPSSQKSAKGVSVQALAAYIDAREQEAKIEMGKMISARSLKA